MFFLRTVFDTKRDSIELSTEHLYVKPKLIFCVSEGFVESSFHGVRVLVFTIVNVSRRACSKCRSS